MPSLLVEPAAPEAEKPIGRALKLRWARRRRAA